MLPVRRKFAAKMTAVIVAVILLPMVFTSVSFYIVSSSAVKSNVRQSTQQIARQAADSLSSVITAAEDISDLIYSDMNLQNAVRPQERSFEESYWNDVYIVSVLNNLAYSSSYVRMIYILREQDVSWGSGTFSPAKLTRHPLNEQEWVRMAIAKDGQPLWRPLQYDTLSGAAETSDLVLPVVRVMKNFDDLSNIAYLVVNIGGEELLQTIRQIELGRTGRFFVVDEQGAVMIAEDLAEVGRPIANVDLLRKVVSEPYTEFEYEEDGVLHYGVKRPLLNGWMAVGTVPVHEITGELDALRQAILYSFALFTLLAVAIGLLTAGRVTKPIKQLTRQMKLVEGGDLRARTAVTSRDEIGMLSRQFNVMLSRIESLMEQVKKEQIEKQEAELRAVMHRINPHFLFNTLSTIRWLIKYDQSAKAYEGISALIRLLEANMGKKGNMLTINEELDIVRKYMAILELRYNLNFDLETSVSKAAGRERIPRMLLQPLVENAVFHGFVPVNKNGVIRITAELYGEDMLELVIADDGRGMSKSRLEEVRRAVHRRDGERIGIGLLHLAESVAIHYGRGSQIDIFSREGEGTTFVVRLQQKRDEA